MRVEPRPEGVAEQTGPVFVVGQPRSGTTLLRAVISAHPRLHVMAETHFLSFWQRRHAKADFGSAAGFHAFWDALVAERFPGRDEFTGRALARIEAADERSPRSIYRALMEEDAARVERPRWGEKTGANLYYLETLFNWYPDARIAWIVRDPRAVAASIVRMPWGPVTVTGAARSWRRAVEVEGARWEGDERVLFLRYEDLVFGPERELRRLCTFLGEGFAPRMLRSHHAGQMGRRHTSFPGQGGESGTFVTVAAERWRETLAAYEVAIVERVCGPAMARIRYEPSGPRPSAATFAAAVVRDHAAALGRRRARLRRSKFGTRR